jgi:phage tail-like protein
MAVNPNKATGLPGGSSGKGDPIGAYHFGIEIQGIENARFTEVTGFEHSSKIIEHREVDAKGQIYINKTIGGTSWTEVTFKRGTTTDNTFWEKWRQQVMDGNYAEARKTVTVTGYDPNGTAVSKFVMVNAWVSKWKGPAFTAKGDNVAVEEITFTHEGISRET